MNATSCGWFCRSRCRRHFNGISAPTESLVHRGKIGLALAPLSARGQGLMSPLVTLGRTNDWEASGAAAAARYQSTRRTRANPLTPRQTLGSHVRYGVESGVHFTGLTQDISDDARAPYYANLRITADSSRIHTQETSAGSALHYNHGRAAGQTHNNR